MFHCSMSRFRVRQLFSLRSVGIVQQFGSASYYSYAAEPSQPLKRQPVWSTAEEAVQCIKSCDTVFISGGVGVPTTLSYAMVAHGEKNTLSNVHVTHLLTEGCAPWAQEKYNSIFRSCSLYVGANLRDYVSKGKADSVPVSSSQVPSLFTNKLIEPDVALIQVSPADEHGFCSLGTSVDCTRAAIIHSKYIIAQVNPQMPRTFGDSLVHQSHFDYAVCIDEFLQRSKSCQPNEAEIVIGKLIAEHLVHDGATIQLGVGAIPNAVMMALKGHRSLGIHTEVLNVNDYFVQLIDCGAVTNSCKKFDAGRIVAATIVGDNTVFSLMNNNPLFEMRTLDYTNCIFLISQQPKMTSINTAIEVDLTGQVCSDSEGAKIHSGFGGQADFMKGSLMCTNGAGKPIIALTACNSKGESAIKNFLTPGAGVVTSRADVNYVVTEYGVACLQGRNLRQRAFEMIQIAHPNVRCSLEQEAYHRLGAMPRP